MFGKMMKKEKEFKHMLEKKTDKIPAKAFLCAVGVCAATAVTMKCMHRKNAGMMVGHFIAPIMLLGLLHKVEKQERMMKLHKFHKRPKRQSDCGCR
ncbi:MAG: hypothetical protein LUD68_00680 [Rikenellaceae bacterium]|nr:hypothetical protein [Rikenellaceae bacterium]